MNNSKSVSIVILAGLLAATLTLVIAGKIIAAKASEYTACLTAVSVTNLDIYALEECKKYKP